MNFKSTPLVSLMKMMPNGINIKFAKETMIKVGPNPTIKINPLLTNNPTVPPIDPERLLNPIPVPLLSISNISKKKNLKIPNSPQ